MNCHKFCNCKNISIHSFYKDGFAGIHFISYICENIFVFIISGKFSAIIYLYMYSPWFFPQNESFRIALEKEAVKARKTQG